MALQGSYRLYRRAIVGVWRWRAHVLHRQPRGLKTLNATDLASNQLVNVLSDPGFQGPIHEAEKNVSGSMMLSLVSS